MIQFLLFFSKYPNINFTIYTSTISKQLKLDFENIQNNIKYLSKTFKSSHDRFLIIDKKRDLSFGSKFKRFG